jgi:hypothetical protein
MNQIGINYNYDQYRRDANERYHEAERERQAREAQREEREERQSKKSK